LKEYPATLHINIDKDFRRRNAGTLLMERFLRFLKEDHIAGVHLSTASESAKIFFTRAGFTILFKGRRSYLRYYLGEDIPSYILGKRL